MAAAGAIGLVARIGGVGTLVSGLGEINTGFASTATGAKSLGSALDAVTNNFQAFQAGAQVIQTSLGSIQFAANAVATPFRAVGSAVSEVAEVAGAASSRIVGVLGDIAGATAALGTTGAIGIGALAGALASGIGASIGLAARFHQELVDLGAIAQATPAQIAQVEEAVKRMSQQFALAIPDIQRTALELTKAGIAPEAVAGGVLKVTLALQQLSKGELSAEQAGQGIGSLLALFDRQFKESGQTVEEFSLRIANAVAAVANNTRATIGEVISGVNILAPTLEARGQSLETIFTALNVALSKGLRGEVAGTGFRNLFNALINPSQEALKIIKELELQDISPFDLQGNIRPALDVLRSIQKVFSETESKLTPAQREQAAGAIFRTRSATVAAIVREVGPEGITKFQDELSRTNVLAQAASQMETLTRQLGLLKNAAELAAISFGQNFLGALTDAGEKLNTFLSAGGTQGRAAQAGSVLGGGLSALVTGQNAGGAFAGITQQFGEGPGNLFADMFNQVDALRAPVTSLLGDIGKLGQTFGNVLFPAGPGEAVAKLGDLLQAGVAIADRFVNFLNGNLPATAENLRNLASEAQTFLGELVNIVTSGRGLDELPQIWSDLQPLIQTARDTFHDVALNAASLARTIIDNRQAILSALQALVVVIGAIDNFFITIFKNATNLFGLLAKPVQFQINLVSNEIELLKKIFGIAGAGISAAQGGLQGAQQGLAATLNVPVGTSNPAAAGLGAGGLTPLPGLAGIGPLSAPVAGPPIPRDLEQDLARQQRSLETLSEAERTSATQTDLMAQAFAGAADSAQALTTASNTSAGAVQVDVAKAAAAAKTAEDAVKRSSDRLTEALEDAEKSQRAAFRGLERSLAGIEQRYNDTLDSIAEQLNDTFNQINKSADDQKKELQDAFDIRNVQQAIRDQFNINQQTTRTTFQRAQEDRQRDRAQFNEDILSQESRFNEDQLNLFRQGEDAVARERQRGIDKSNVEFQRGQEDKLKILTRSQEDIQRLTSQGFENRNLSVSRAREDAEAQRILARDLAKATTSDERARILTQSRESQEDLKRRRGFEDTDRQTQRQQEQQLLTLRRGQEDQVGKFRRDQEDALTARRNQQATDDVDFRISQELRFAYAQRAIQDAEKDRRRILDAQELIFRRQDENKAFAFQTEQQRDARNLELEFAIQDLNRALAKVEQTRQERLGEVLVQTGRRVATANRTTFREAQGAFQQYNDSIISGQARLADISTDIPRSIRDQRAALLAIDPTASLESTQRALATLDSVNGAIANSNAVLGATAIVAQNQGQQAVDALLTRLGGPGGLKDTADGALTKLLSDIQELHSVTEGPGGTVTITTVLNSPQAERLAIAMEQLVNKIDNIKPGVNIGTVEQQFSEPETPGDALQSLRTVGGAV